MGKSAICAPGWTATIRSPASYATALKVKQLAGSYALNGDTKTAGYEEDHLIRSPRAYEIVPAKGS
jgi:hypothetical protein